MKAMRGRGCKLCTFCRLCHLGPGIVSSQLFHAHIQTHGEEYKVCKTSYSTSKLWQNFSAMCCCDKEEHLHLIASQNFALEVCATFNKNTRRWIDVRLTRRSIFKILDDVFDTTSASNDCNSGKAVVACSSSVLRIENKQNFQKPQCVNRTRKRRHRANTNNRKITGKISQILTNYENTFLFPSEQAQK